MSTMSSEGLQSRSAGREVRWTFLKEMWGTIGIIAMWVAVLFDGVYGGDVVSMNGPTSQTVIPSAVFVAFFAFLATAALAKRAFGPRAKA
jgi:hypothetical protein